MTPRDSSAATPWDLARDAAAGGSWADAVAPQDFPAGDGDDVFQQETQKPEVVRPGARRAFSHRAHVALSCLMCHGAGERHRTFLGRSEGDCAACHHSAARSQDCTRCHGESRRAAGAVSVRLQLTVWDEARTRRLPFSHDIHQARDCTECHRATGAAAMPLVQCGQCHEAHHRPEADCSTCHEAVPEATHPIEAHLSCAGGTCHAPTVAPSPGLSRSLCLVCHATQVEHEPGAACAECHEIPGIHAAGADSAMATEDTPPARGAVLARAFHWLWRWLR